MRQSGLIGFFFGIVLILAPIVGMAQDAVVRAGEHPDFTRITVELPRGSDWTLAQAPGQAEISLSGAVSGFDITQLFNRIPRSRLRDVELRDGPVMVMNLTCACAVDSMLYQGNLVVMDIREGQPLPPGRALPAIAPVPLADPLANLQANMTPPAPEPTDAGMALPLPGMPEPTAVTPLQTPLETELRDYARDRIAGPPEVPGILSEAELRLTRQLEENLLRAIGGAATEGLLQADTGYARQLNETLQAPPEEVAEADKAERSDPEVAPGPEGREPGLSARTSTLEAARPGPSGRFILSGDPCVLAMPASQPPEEEIPFSQALGTLRTALTGEFDRPDPQAHRDLAHFYILRGFGAEALSVLRAAPQSGQAAAEMEAAARILEYGSDSPDGIFARRLDCDSEAAMWGVLSLNPLPPGRDVNVTAIKRSLMTLPKPLKAYLGPMLVERFHAAQEPEIARDLLRQVARETGEPNPRQELAAARLDGHETGQPDQDSYKDLIAANDDVSAEALVTFTEQTLAGGGPVDAETIGLLESFRQQYRDSPILGPLTRAEIAARGSAGDFVNAYDLLEAEAATVPADSRDRTADKLAEQMVARADDVVLTTLYFRHRALIPKGLSPATANALAGRLMKVGLLDEADRFLGEGAQGADGRARRLLRGELALARNLPRQAEAEVAGLEGPDVDYLRGDLNLKTGNYAEAERLYRAAGDDQAAENAALLARDWARLRDSGDQPAARVAEVVSDQAAAPPDLPALGPPTLAASRDVLSQSADTRDALRDLLSSVQLDTALDQPAAPAQ